jgi:hypothetical protein
MRAVWRAGHEAVLLRGGQRAFGRDLGQPGRRGHGLVVEIPLAAVHCHVEAGVDALRELIAHE